MAFSLCAMDFCALPIKSITIYPECYVSIEYQTTWNEICASCWRVFFFLRFTCLFICLLVFFLFASLSYAQLLCCNVIHFHVKKKPRNWLKREHWSRRMERNLFEEYTNYVWYIEICQIWNGKCMLVGCCACNSSKIDMKMKIAIRDCACTNTTLLISQSWNFLAPSLKASQTFQNVFLRNCLPPCG